MNIVYHSSDSFAPVLGISIASVFENNKEFENIIVYIIENAISEENKKKLLEMAEIYNRSIIFIPLKDVNEFEHLNLLKVKEKWIFDSYCRLFLDDYLPKTVDRVLYLDSDVLVVDSLKDLWDLDLQGTCVAAVKDCFSESYYRLFKFSDGYSYYNSGIILFDLKKWHNLNMAKKIREYVAINNGYVFYMEQTVFSFLMQGNIFTLPPNYNVNSMIQFLSFNEMYKLRRFSRYYSEKEIESAVSHPIIIHMTTSFLIINRAWNEVSNHPMKNECKKYAMLTPWGENALSKDSRNIRQKTADFLIRIIPKSILLPILSYVYNNLRIRRIEKTQKRIIQKADR